MDCPICRDLERAFEAAQGEYIEARLSACHRVCGKFAAHKNVDMERARYELEEHRFICVSAVDRTSVLTSAFVRSLIGESTDRSDGEKVEYVQLALAS
jgi:hypothetical protein